MNKAIINGGVELSYPAGFEPMTERELTEGYGSPDKKWAVWDKERHLIFTVIANKPNALLLKLADLNGTLKRVESSFKNKLKDYVRLGDETVAVGGVSVPGFRYEYSVGDVRQEGTVFVAKHKGHIYAFYTYARKGDASADAVFGEITGSVKFI